jgi:hypothetical protein
VKRYHFYHRESGLFHREWFMTDDERPEVLAANTPADHLAIEGEFDHLSQRVDLSGPEARVVDYQPPQPRADHLWDEVTRRWRLDPAVVERQQRRAAALERITALEAAQARPMRELALNLTNAEARKRLEGIEAQIAQLRQQTQA